MSELFLVPAPAKTQTPAKPRRPARISALAKPELPDAYERAAALDIRQSWIVEAPAGSGKTGLLIQRYLKLLAEGSVTEPEQVLAITFTNKATAEMRERIVMQLRSAAEQTEPADAFERATRTLAESVLARSSELGWSLLEQPKRFNIRTIDSVCSNVANSLPLLSGSGGRSSPVDDAAPLYALAARRTFMELGKTGNEEARELHDALSTVLLHRDGNLADCEKLLGEMLERRDQWGKFGFIGRARLDDAWLDANVLPTLERALDRAICDALTQLSEAVPADLLAQLTTAAAEMAHNGGYRGKPSPIAFCAGKFQSPTAVAEDLEHWRALVHLLVAPSTQSWRKRHSKSDVKFQIDKSDQARLSGIVQRLQHNDELLTMVCKVGPLPPAQYPAEQWAVAKALFRILNRALVELQLVFAERGDCDFTEVALAAQTALTWSDGSGDLEAAIGFHLQHILVDEMQDTSSSQYDLIQALTRNWDGHSQTAFLVGDPKQSIYLFRQARVERFLRTMRGEHLGDLPLGCLRLTANFRSQARLVEEFNADFASIFPTASDSLHPDEIPYTFAHSARGSLDPTDSMQDESPQLGLPFNYSLFGEEAAAPLASRRNVWNGGAVPISAAVTNASAPARIWHARVLPYERDTLQKARNTRAQRLADAEETVGIVESWRSRPLPTGRADPWKIAVLCRSRNHLDEIVTAFKSAAIPFRAVEIDPLKDRSEVQDLIAITRALLHPADRVAWLAMLRAPWCGLTLSELHTLAGSDDPTLAGRSMQQVVAERGHLLSDDACRRLQRIWPALEAAVKARGRIPAAELVERTWRSFGGDSYLTSPELANATRYLELLDEIEELSGTVELSFLEQKLEKLYAAPIIQAGAVDLLTVHKAKGLEWDVVIVPALERRAPVDRNRLITWVELDSSDEQSAHVLLAPIASKGEESRELTKWIRGINSSREAAERKRLFYVACTRAREELHLFAAPVSSAKGEINPDGSSLLAAAWPAAKPYFSSTQSAASDFGAVEESDEPLAIAASSESGPFDDDSDYAKDLDESLSAAVRSDSEIEPMPADGQLELRIPSQTAPLQRLPLDFNPSTRLRSEHPLSKSDVSDPTSRPRFLRPEGSLAARAFGNAVHAFLEQIAHRLAEGESSGTLLAKVAEWTPRFAAILRSEGLQPAVVERLTQRVQFALETTMKDATGLWLLSSHTGAASEFTLTTWAAQRRSIRVDRVFYAGPEPLSVGASHLWIVDYKTTAQGAEGLEAFLAAEKINYAPQLEVYAEILSQSNSNATLRLALYYPLIAKLIWWPWNG